MKKIIIIVLIVLAIIAVGLAGYFLSRKPAVKLSPEQQKLQDIMSIVKTDKDYADFTVAVKNFNPELVNYQKLGPEEYEILMADWKKNNLAERARLLEGLNLTDSTYLVELKDKNDENRSLMAVIDIKEKKSLLIFVTVNVSVKM